MLTDVQPKFLIRLWKTDSCWFGLDNNIVMDPGCRWGRNVLSDVLDGG